MMKLLSSTSRLALVTGASMFFTALAHAGGTDAGRSVENTFTLDYQVGGTDQGTITNDPTYTAGPGDPSPVIDPSGPTDFTVDRLIDVTMTATNSGLLVPPNSQDRILTFTVTNTGNDYQSYSFSIADVAGDDFDATGLEITYSRAAFDLNGDSDTTDPCEAAITDAALTATATGTAAGSASYTCDIPPDLPFTVSVSGDMPDTLNESDADDLVLVAETRNPTAWVFETPAPTEGAVTSEDGDATNTIDGVAENVFADGSNTSEEAATDGLISAQSSYIVTDPDLVAEKAVQLVRMPDDVTDCATDSVSPSEVWSVPGACVEYTITVTNTGEVAGSDADGIEIVDVLPDDVAFVSAVASGFSTAGTLTWKKADNTTDCDGTAGETCTVRLAGASLDAIAGATDAVATLTIRATVR